MMNVRTRHAPRSRLLQQRLNHLFGAAPISPITRLSA